MIATLLPPRLLEDCFAEDYAGAHARFRRACDRLDDSRFREYVYSESGPEGDKLRTATCWLGDPDADKVLVLQSATHGVEGFCGSAIQIDFINRFCKSKPEGNLGVLLIHALNPYGFAWLRRVNEDGVDLNRNFVDFNRPLPDNTAYARLAEDLLPADKQDLSAATERLQQQQLQLGAVAYEQAISGGQYAFADGLFYGGRAPSRSRQYLQTIVSEYELAARSYVAVIDIHTGLGPFAYGEVICDHPPGSKGVAWAKRVYGQSVTEPALGTSSSVPKQGLVDYYWHETLADKVCFVTLEFGTYPVAKLFEVLRHDHMLHRSQIDWHSPAVQKVKQKMRNHFYPATADWQEMVLLRGRQLVRQAINGLLD